MILGNPAFWRDSFLKSWLLVLLSTGLAGVLSAQGIQGRVMEAMSRQPVSGATIQIFHHGELIHQTTSDSLGDYRWISGMAGRVRIDVSAPEYHSLSLTDILLDGYSISRAEYEIERLSFDLPGVTVRADGKSSTPFLRSIRPGDMQLTAAHFDDPVRIAHSQPGIVLLNDQTNQFSARGQSPLFNSWYLEGLEIVNPNHTSNAGTFSDLPTTSGGGVNMFSAQSLGATDVYTGINPMSIQRTAGAVMNMHLYESSKPEWRAKAGLIGLELGGGAALGEKSILDVNVRYSFTGILTGLGADFGGERIGFYDGVVSYTHTGNRHKLKWFAWGGRSENHFDKTEPLKDRERYKEFFDIDFESEIGGSGIRYDRVLGDSYYLKSGFSFSTSGTTYQRVGQFGETNENLQLSGRLNVSSAFAEVSFHSHQRWNGAAGINWVQREFNDDGFHLPLLSEARLRPYLHSSYQLLSRVAVEAGVEITFENKLYNRSSLPGYRATITWSGRDKFDVFAGVRQSAGPSVLRGPVAPEQIRVTKMEAGVRHQSLHHESQVQFFHQTFHALAVNRLPDGGFYHLADVFEPMSFGPLFNIDLTGQARQYGMEADGTWISDNGWRFNFNSTIYKSLQGISDQPMTRSRFDGQVATHVALSKEITRQHKGKYRIWNFNVRGLLHGGLWAELIDVAASADAGTTIYNDPGRFTEKLPVYQRIDLGVARTISTPQVRWRYSLDIQNVAGWSNIAYHFYDPFLARTVAQEQLGIIPVLSVQASW